MSKNPSVSPGSAAWLDQLLWGAKKIAEEANLVDEDGNPDVRAAYHALERGHIPAKKVGHQWVTTRAQIRSIADA
jgi:hypothetical protein